MQPSKLTPIEVHAGINVKRDDLFEVAQVFAAGCPFAGVLHGLADVGHRASVSGVVVGANPAKRLDAYAPLFWQTKTELCLSGSDYHTPATDMMLGDLALDTIYEAKCLPFLRAGDLLWVVGIR